MTCVLIYESIEWNDTVAEYKKIINWAKKNCPSHTHYTMTDISDASLTHDYVCHFFFDDENDASFFSLVWKE